MTTKTTCPACGALLRYNEYFEKMICMCCGYTRDASECFAGGCEASEVYPAEGMRHDA